MPISFSSPVISNTNQLAGNQNNAQTVALVNGGYVVAWQSNFGGVNNVFFQRYDALGASVGSRTQIANPSVNMVLSDIAVAGDGTFSILTSGSIGPLSADLRLFVNSFDGTTGGPSGPQAVLDLTAFSPYPATGAQIVRNEVSASSLIVVASVFDSSLNSDLLKAVVSTTGSVTLSPFLATENYFNSFRRQGITEAINSVKGNQLAITLNSIIDTVGTFSTYYSGEVRDVLALEPGVFVTASTTPIDSPQVFLTLFAGTTSSILGYLSTGGITSTNARGFTSTGSQIFDVELVDLGAGRILMVWAADGGESSNPGPPSLFDGVYAQVYNMNTGGPEGTATQILSFGLGPNDALLSVISISADRMADGRVAVGLSYTNGLSGQDVFHAVLDPRDAGINPVSFTTLSETFVGTAFDDTFTNVSNGDRIFGGAGIDTVVFGSSSLRSVDLQIPGNFPANSFVLEGIENLTGNNGADLFRGDTVGNVLSGGAGNDTLYGRDGNDSLFGGTNDDLLFGGSSDDVLDGGSGIDMLDGGAGDDLLFGGGDADRLLGGSENDVLYGGDGDDRLQGGAGDDELFGDAGNDILTGGAGDDEMSGGAGLDILRAEDGADSVYGGADNDIIFAHTGVGLVDGGTGTDTLRVSGPLAVNTAGVHVDLTGVFDNLGLVIPLTRFSEDISGIENVTGGTGDDFITGDNAANLLQGGAGNDTIVSGGGADVLFGNAGADVFVFTGTTGGGDELRDYAINTDRIGLASGAFGDINASNIASRLTINATGTVGSTSVAQLIFDNAGTGFGQLLFDADGNGAGTAVRFATLFPATGTLVAITAADFVFI